MPSHGHLLEASVDAALTPLGSDYPYAKVVVRGSQWIPMPWGGHVLQLRAFAGGIFGTAPIFEQFYVGDLSDLLPDSVLGLVFDRRPAPNFLGTDIVEIHYADYAAKLDAEYRIPLYRGTRSVYGIDLFGSAGLYGLANPADFVAPAPGYSGLATVPVDLTFNLGLRIDTQAGGFVLGVSNLVGLAPLSGQQTSTGRP